MRPRFAAGLSKHSIELARQCTLMKFYVPMTATMEMSCVSPKWKTIHRHVTVPLEGHDLVFMQRGKMHIGDMRDWVGDIGSQKLSVNVTIKAVGYPSKAAAVASVRDGNMTNTPVTAEEIRRAFDIYGPLCYAVKGKTTKQIMTRSEFDNSLKGNTPKQKIYFDIMHVRRQAFLMSLVMPLGFATVTPVVNTKAPDLGGAVMTQLSIIRSKVFSPIKVYADPQDGFVGLVGQFTGMIYYKSRL